MPAPVDTAPVDTAAVDTAVVDTAPMKLPQSRRRTVPRRDTVAVTRESPEHMYIDAGDS